jgi:N-acyl amino acid synthase of PEP-CTERM/exosortase system
MNSLSAESTTTHLATGVIDDSLPLLEQSYRLRYQVYCLERGFLPKRHYPDKRESDAFDIHSTHIGVLNERGEIVGTARLVEPSAIGLPLFRYCTLFDDAPSFDDSRYRIVEASRLAISKHCHRDGRGGFCGLQRRSGQSRRTAGRKSGDIVFHIFKGLYQASKRRGYTHWLAATEKSLQRLMTRYGFPFRVIGPETDYYGCVAPYLMDLSQFDRVILSGQIPLLDEFLEGLEPEFHPVDESAYCPSESVL